MTSDRRFEQELPIILEDLLMGPMPPYRDEVLQRTAGIHQRPAWSFLGTWLPFADDLRQLVLPRRISLRTIGLTVVLAAITLAIVAALVGGSRPRVPAPFGLARAGLVAYAQDGDIYTVDPQTGVSTAVVFGPEVDREPHWSRDGTRFAFLRYSEGNSGPSQVYVAQANGAGARVVTPEPLVITGLFGFSPDGSQIGLTAVEPGAGSLPKIMLVRSDGSGARTLERTSFVAAGDSGPSWRPPDGTEILFADRKVSLHAVDPGTGAVRTIVPPSDGLLRETPRWAPDGSRLAYIEYLESGGMTAQIHVVEADGTGDRLLPLPPGAVWQAFRGWSNDGSRLIAIRGYTGAYGEAVAAIVPVDGSGPGVEIDYSDIAEPVCCPEWEWAPDDSLILGVLPGADGRPLVQVLVDPMTGRAAAAPWATTSLPAWQRLAP